MMLSALMGSSSTIKINIFVWALRCLLKKATSRNRKSFLRCDGPQADFARPKRPWPLRRVRKRSTSLPWLSRVPDGFDINRIADQRQLAVGIAHVDADPVTLVIGLLFEGKRVRGALHR